MRIWDSDAEGCSCPSTDMFYACPIEREKPENQKDLEEYGEWVSIYRELKKEGVIDEG